MTFSDHSLSRLSKGEVETLSRAFYYSHAGYEKIISELSKELDINLSRTCVLKNVSFSKEVALMVSTVHSSPSLQEGEAPRSSLKKTDEPAELLAFSYDDLKKRASFAHGKYRGKLYATIVDNPCSLTIDCPDCGGTGKCSDCGGSKQVECPVCEGSRECPDCDGSGRFTCPKCGGDGWIECDDCDNGTFYENCRACGGSGWYRENVPCRVCDGTGQYGKTCTTCGGDGGWDCDYCDDDCCVECRACGGTGDCGKCRGRGTVWCPSCQGKGRCYDCKGEKKVPCPRCEGSGVFQSFTEYTIQEVKAGENFSSLPNLCQHEKIVGEILYDDVVYDFFAKKANKYNLNDIVSCAPSQYQGSVGDWLSLQNVAPSIANGDSDDYFNLRAKLVYFPCTRISFSCRSQQFSIWIVGEDYQIYYDTLPKTSDRVLGAVGNFFGKVFGSKK